MTSLLDFLLQKRKRSRGMGREEKGTEQGSLGAPGRKARSGSAGGSAVLTAAVKIQLWGHRSPGAR